MGKKTYEITVSDTATYRIRANSQEEAENLAWDYFNEREPNIDTVETNDKPDIEI